MRSTRRTLIPRNGRVKPTKEEHVNEGRHHPHEGVGRRVCAVLALQPDDDVSRVEARRVRRRAGANTSEAVVIQIEAEGDYMQADEAPTPTSIATLQHAPQNITFWHNKLSDFGRAHSTLDKYTTKGGHIQSNFGRGLNKIVRSHPNNGRTKPKFGRTRPEAGRHQSSDHNLTDTALNSAARNLNWSQTPTQWPGRPG